MRSAIVARNLAWVAQRTGSEPDYFRRRYEGAAASMLWIGCSDNLLANLEIAPFEGQVLVHRNPGNQVSHHDLNLYAVLQRALHVHKVSDMVVCGHYRCECLRDALGVGQALPGDTWMGPLRELVRRHRPKLDGIVSTDAQVQSLCELNVRAQLDTLAAHALVEPLLAVGNVRLHGVVWSARDGLLREIEGAAPEPRRGRSRRAAAGIGDPPPYRP